MRFYSTLIFLFFFCLSCRIPKAYTKISDSQTKAANSSVIQNSNNHGINSKPVPANQNSITPSQNQSSPTGARPK